MSAKRHPGITMHRLTFGGGLEGLTFVVGSVLIFVFGLPALWYFVALALALGIGIAVFLRLANSRSSERNKPLSILHAAPKKPQDPVPQRQNQNRRVFRLLSKPSAA